MSKSRTLGCLGLAMSSVAARVWVYRGVFSEADDGDIWAAGVRQGEGCDVAVLRLWMVCCEL